jgi:hypothetical protein
VTVYADDPGRRLRQVLGDLGAVGWVVAWVAVGRAVHGAVLRLGEPGRVLADAGRSLESGLRDGAAALGRTPLLGDELRAPFDSAGDAARTLATAGADAQTAVGRAALLAGVAVAAWPILLGAGGWLVHRWRWARRARAVRRVAARDDGVDLLALRALATAPLSRLATVGPDPSGGWRRGDPRTVRALAALTLRDVGLRDGGPHDAPPDGPAGAPSLTR